MPDFRAEHGVNVGIEPLPLNTSNEALGRLRRNDVRYQLHPRPVRPLSGLSDLG